MLWKNIKMVETSANFKKVRCRDKEIEDWRETIIKGTENIRIWKDEKSK